MLAIQRPTEGIALLKSGSDLVVAGYASVELVDKQGDLITQGALNDAFGNFMKSDRFRNVQLAHSNIQVGEVIDSYVDNNGRMWKSEVDDTGMFVVVKLRNDIEKAREVAAEIRKGNLRGFSIGGQAFKRVRRSDFEKGDYQEISKMELHEITICEKGINPEAQFRILKEDKTMTDADMSSIMERLEKRLDDLEKGDLPPFMEKKKDEAESKDDKPKEEKKDDEGDDMKEMEKSEYSDVITSEYLSWMEGTLKSAGIDTDAARTHFDNLEKAQLGGFDNPDAVDGADYFGGQDRGRGQEGGSPSTGAINAITSSGGKTPSGALGPAKLSKGYLNHGNVSDADIEAAYEVYKAAAQEQHFRNDLEGHFANRFNHEVEIAKAQQEKAAFDAREPLGQIMKTLETLNERIDNIGASGVAIQKSAGSNIEIPSTQDLANMGWDEVHALASRTMRGE